MSDPKDLEPGKVYPLDIELHLTTWVFPKGHRIRLAVSNALWPMIWPTPFNMTTTLQLGAGNGSRLTLPLVPPSLYAVPKYAPPEPSEERKDIVSIGFPFPGEWTTERDRQEALLRCHTAAGGEADRLHPGSRWSAPAEL